MKYFVTLLSMSIAAPIAAHEAGLPHAHTSETTWVPVTLLVAVVVAVVLVRKASAKS